MNITNLLEYSSSAVAAAISYISNLGDESTGRGAIITAVAALTLGLLIPIPENRNALIRSRSEAQAVAEGLHVLQRSDLQTEQNSNALIASGRDVWSLAR